MRLAARVYPLLRSHDLLKRSFSRPADQLKTWFLMTFPRFQSRPSSGMQPLVVAVVFQLQYGYSPALPPLPIRPLVVPANTG